MRVALAILSILAITASTADARHRHRHHREQDYSNSEDKLPLTSPSFRRAGPSLAQLLPRDWKVQPPEPNWTGKRFTSPDGSAWFAIYSSPVEQESVSAHMKEIAFGEGETLTYLRGEKDWIASSGFKGDRIFYRKAVIACAGRSWHQIAFEYPVRMKQSMDTFVNGAAAAVQNSEDDGCDKELWSNTLPQNESR